MKNSIYYLIIIAIVSIFSLTNCKNKVEADRISECALISGGSMEARTNNCRSCCINNGWDNGTYWEVGEVGCECDKK